MISTTTCLTSVGDIGSTTEEVCVTEINEPLVTSDVTLLISGSIFIGLFTFFVCFYVYTNSR
jgi:hypothetical protein